MCVRSDFIVCILAPNDSNMIKVNTKCHIAIIEDHWQEYFQPEIGRKNRNIQAWPVKQYSYKNRVWVVSLQSTVNVSEESSIDQELFELLQLKDPNQLLLGRAQNTYQHDRSDIRTLENRSIVVKSSQFYCASGRHFLHICNS